MIRHFRPRALLATAALGLAVVGPTAAPSAALAQQAPVVVGGPALASGGVVAGPGAPGLPPVRAASFLVADLDTGQVLAAKNPHGRFATASTLKTLTAVTLIPRLDPRRLVRPTRQDVDVDGTKVGIVTSMSYPVDELMRAMLVVSGNDAAGALATAAGGIPATTALMNAEARRLQAYDTHAATPSGLDAPGQASSAYDLALIARAGMAMPAFRGYVATKHSSIAAPKHKRIQIGSHDKLLYNYPGAIGIKNGYTVAARASFVGAARRDGHTLVVTVMRGEPRVWHDAAALLDWGFTATRVGAQPNGELVGPRPAAGAASAPAAQRQLLPAAAVAARPAGAGARPRCPAGAGRSPALPLAAIAGLVGLAVVLRRRRVVVRRRRRSAALRAHLR